MNPKQLLKSKTINFNALIPAIVVLTSALGYPIPPEAVAAIFSIGNIVLRMVTTKPISEK